MMLGGVVIGLCVPGLGIRGRLIVWGICGSLIVLIASPAGGTLLNTRSITGVLLGGSIMRAIGVNVGNGRSSILDEGGATLNIRLVPIWVVKCVRKCIRVEVVLQVVGLRSACRLVSGILGIILGINQLNTSMSMRRDLV